MPLGIEFSSKRASIMIKERKCGAMKCWCGGAEEDDRGRQDVNLSGA